MSLQSLPELKAEVIRLGKLIGATDLDLPTFAVYEQKYNLRPCVDVDAAGYHYFIVQGGKGIESGRVTTPDLDELFYHVFRYVSILIAKRYTWEHRIDNQLIPHLQLQKQIELMAMLSGFKWADRRAKELERLSLIEVEAMRLVSLISVSDHYLPTFGGYPYGDGELCVDVDGNSYDYFWVERGGKSTRASTTDLDELLYHIFNDLTGNVADRYEVQHRISSQDRRRLIFQKELELLGMLSPKWVDRKAAEQNKILLCRPYDDAVNIRVDFYKELKAQGHTPAAANELADKEYPRPIPQGKDC